MRQVGIWWDSGRSGWLQCEGMLPSFCGKMDGITLSCCERGAGLGEVPRSLLIYCVLVQFYALLTQYDMA